MDRDNAGASGADHHKRVSVSIERGKFVDTSGEIAADRLMAAWWECRCGSGVADEEE
jgi:hypothetical protein